MLTGGKLSRRLFVVGSISFGNFKSMYSKCYANMQWQYNGSWHTQMQPYNHHVCSVAYKCDAMLSQFTVPCINSHYYKTCMVVFQRSQSHNLPTWATRIFHLTKQFLITLQTSAWSVAMRFPQKLAFYSGCTIHCVKCKSGCD